MRVVFAEACWFITAAVFNVHYELLSVAAAAVAGVLPDADYPKSWTRRMLGSVSEGFHRFSDHRSFLHSYLALTLVTATVGLLLWWLLDRPTPLLAIFVGYGSHILADMMTVGGIQFFWPSRVIAVFPGCDEYRVLSGSTSERVFFAVALVFALLFYPVSKVGFDGLIYRMGGAETPYATIVEVLDGDTLSRAGARGRRPTNESAAREDARAERRRADRLEAALRDALRPPRRRSRGRDARAGAVGRDPRSYPHAPLCHRYSTKRKRQPPFCGR